MPKWALLVVVLVAMPGLGRADDAACGDDGLTCGPNQRCCEHVVATFGASGPLGPSFVEGRCVAKEARCGEFWCGPRRCEPGFFGSPSVCCVERDPNHSTEYRCALSELSCPGNTQQLTIRDHTPERILQGS